MWANMTLPKHCVCVLICFRAEFWPVSNVEIRWPLWWSCRSLAITLLVPIATRRQSHNTKSSLQVVPITAWRQLHYHSSLQDNSKRLNKDDCAAACWFTNRRTPDGCLTATTPPFHYRRIPDGCLKTTTPPIHGRIPDGCLKATTPPVHCGIPDGCLKRLHHPSNPGELQLLQLAIL